MPLTTIHDSEAGAAATKDSWTKPMNNYNQNSSYQAEVNAFSCKILKEQAKEVSAHFKDEFHIADFGCSHGKNSMECIKSAFDGYEGNPSFIRVYLNDLPTNEFGEVFKCLNDSSISYNQHPLALNTNISTCVNGLSFSKQCFPSDHLHISFSYHCIHWLERPIYLSRALFTKSNRVTREEAEALSNDAHSQFVAFLKSRAKELVSGGRLLVSFLRGGSILMDMENIWNVYIKGKGYQITDFGQVAIPVYSRSDDEVQMGLDEVQDKFRILVMENYCHSTTRITSKVLESAIFSSMVEGLQKTGIFNSSGECEDFIRGYFKSFETLDGDNDFKILVLERI